MWQWKQNLKEDAVKISTDFIKSNIIFKDVDSFPMDISELSIWKDRLVWTVKIDNIKVAGSTYGFDFKIDAVKVENKYYYTYNTDNSSPKGMTKHKASVVFSKDFEEIYGYTSGLREKYGEMSIFKSNTELETVYYKYLD